MANIITSDSFIEIEQHFRVSAGPGAGKTHWLVNHIKNVLHNSERLRNSKKIACITYTNVAVSTIINRLPNSSNDVVVSTIHSFLYKDVIKPYIRFIANDYGINIKKIDGHDEIIIGRNFIIEWISNLSDKNKLRHPYTENQLTLFPNNTNALINWVSSIRFKLDINGEIFISSDRRKAMCEYNNKITRLNKYCLDILEPNLLELKRCYWRNGLLHHDDILYFSYILITKYPFILNVLRAKFPYFFVDEFQDSNPIQIKILNLIGLQETIVGVIGDKAQSIYGFQGADSSQFERFNLNGIQDYIMIDNRRSSNEIIDFLNHIRPEFKQNKIKKQSGDKPLLLIGDKIENFIMCKEFIADEELCTLSRKNIVSNIMKREVGINISSDLFKQILEEDGDNSRRRVICSFVKAIEYAKNNRYKDALKEIKSLYKVESSYKEIKTCLIVLQKLLNNYELYKNSTLKEFCEFVSSDIIHLSKISSRGKAFEIYNSNTYQQLAVCVNITDDDSLNRTIHKAKGDEFDNVMIILETEEDLSFISDPDINNEEHRIMYVAASRAKKRLFISVPKISTDNKIITLIGGIINMN